MVDEISRFQKTERRSKILGAVQYFQELAEVLGRGELTQASRHQLENSYFELTAIQIHLEDDVKALVDTIFWHYRQRQGGIDRLCSANYICTTND